VRVKVQCKDPGAVSGTSSVCLNGLGYNITWVVETNIVDNKNLSAPSEPKGDKDDEDEEEEKSDSYSPFLEEFAK
jgi:hypothetical protein